MKKIVIVIVFLAITPILYSKNKIITLYKAFPNEESTITNDYLMHPHDLKILNDRFIVCDLEESCVKIFNNKGDFINKIGRMGQGPGEIGAAFKVSVDIKKALLYVLDPSNSRISIFRDSGEYIKSIKILTPPGNLLYINGLIHTCGYNDARGTLFSIYDSNGKLIKTYEKYFDKKIPNNRFASRLYSEVNMTNDDENIYVLFEYIPYICIYSKEGDIKKRVLIKNKKIMERYEKNIQAVKRGIENGFLKIFGWNNGGVLYKDKVYYLTNLEKGYDETLIVFNLDGEYIENIMFEGDGIDKGYYKFAAKMNDDYIFYDWSIGKIKIYREK